VVVVVEGSRDDLHVGEGTGGRLKRSTMLNHPLQPQLREVCVMFSRRFRWLRSYLWQDHNSTVL